MKLQCVVGESVINLVSRDGERERYLDGGGGSGRSMNTKFSYSFCNYKF